MTDIEDLYDGFSSVLKQSNTVTMSYDAPTLESIDPSDLVSDGKEFADELFEPEQRIFRKEMALQQAYDASQAYARIISLYEKDRSDFYNQAVDDNLIRIQRYEWKKKILEQLSETS